MVMVGVSGDLWARPAEAAPDVIELYEMATKGHGADALDVLADEAFRLGGWQPAPGDSLVYDSTLPWWTRAEVRTADRPPAECDVPKLSQCDACQMIDREKERQVRFGVSTFSNRREDGISEPRPVFDDLLATYIEEVGHSWQEYLYETKGLGAGERLLLTPWEEAVRWMPGREYQIKRYVLALDGTWLALSSSERGLLRAAICDEDGYANPTGRSIPPYGPPSHWPQPDGWPLVAPDAEDMATLCAGWQ